MKALSIRVTAESPLSIRADHAPEGARGAPYIPGTTLVGALAAAYRMLNPAQTEEFEQLFLREQVLYPNLYPASFADKTGRDKSGMEGTDLPVYPIPKTGQSCKRHDGFCTLLADDEAKGHGVRDSLIDWAIAKLGEAQNSDDPVAALREHKLCPWPHKDWPSPNTKDKLCGEVMDHFNGYYRRNTKTTEFNNDMVKARTNTRLRTHTGIDRATGTVEEGILYNREVFDEDTRFWGRIQFLDDENLVKHFEDFIKTANRQRLIRIGTGRTRGMGKVTIGVKRLEEAQNDFASFQERLCGLNNLLHKQANKINGLDDSFYFALTLHSPLILCDGLLRYRGTIDEDVLQELLGPGYQISGLKRIYQAASVSRVTGWQEMWGLPRTNEYAIDTGSVFLFECTQPLDEEVMHRLFDLEEQGAGKRRVEGFGRICVSDQFHQEISLR
jgi:CRISPR-associated Csx10 family RAMP protein